MATTIEQRLKGLENERDLLWREVRALRERLDRQWAAAVDQIVRVSNDGDSGYLDTRDGLRVMWGSQDVTPSWTNATNHAYSGPHTITLPASFDDTSFQIVAQGSDGLPAGRAAWLVWSSPVAVNSFNIYLAAPDAGETSTTGVGVRYIVLGNTP